MQPPERRTVSGQVFSRSAKVRKKILSRANGKCEWYETPDFETSDGKICLETHHIIPISENGLDRAGNVVALCANDHRESHHGKNKAVVRETLLRRFDRSDQVNCHPAPVALVLPGFRAMPSHNKHGHVLPFPLAARCRDVPIVQWLVVPW